MGGAGCGSKLDCCNVSVVQTKKTKMGRTPDASNQNQENATTGFECRRDHREDEEHHTPSLISISIHAPDEAMEGDASTDMTGEGGAGRRRGPPSDPSNNNNASPTAFEISSRSNAMERLGGVFQGSSSLRMRTDYRASLSLSRSAGERHTQSASSSHSLSEESEGKPEDPPLYDVDVDTAGTSLPRNAGGSSEGTRSGATLYLSASCIQRQVQDMPWLDGHVGDDKGSI